MNTNSNSYTIIYAAIMVVIVAFLLAFVSSSLKDMQNANVKNDTKKQILSAINVTEVTDADAEFAKYEVKDMLAQADGTLAPKTCTINRNDVLGSTINFTFKNVQAVFCDFTLIRSVEFTFVWSQGTVSLC